MHEVQAKAILSAGKNGMNLYRGCTHGCIYCDARSRCYQMNEQLDAKLPGMKERYHKTYGYAYEILSPNGRELWSVFSDFCKKHGMMYKEDAIFTYLNTYEEKGYEQLVFPGLEL